MDLDERILKYKQPHSIKPPNYMNPLEADRFREYEHNRLKHEARYRAKYTKKDSKYFK